MSDCILQLGAHLNLMVSLFVHCSREEEQTLLQFVSCSVLPLECIDMTRMTFQRDYKHRG